VVIGGGTAGLVTSAAGGLLGARVALVEAHLLGGDCTNYGCVPSKALLSCARQAEAVRTSAEYGMQAQEPQIDFSAVMARMRRLRAQISANDSAARFSDFGADVYFGRASFQGRHQLRVGDTVLEFKKAVIATGARAAVPEISGLKEAGFQTNETVFSLDRLPQHLIVLGGGPIGCELSQAFRRLGSRVTLVTTGKRLLPKDDPEAGSLLFEQFQREAIDVILSATVLSVETKGDTRRVLVRTSERSQILEGDQLLVAAGRQANVDSLALQAAGVQFDRHGVVVNDHLRTSNPNIFAAGDVCSAYQFTHAAEAMARLVVQNALFFGRKRISRLLIPWCTYTDPEVAHVGISAEEAARLPQEINVYSKHLADVDRAILDGTPEGYARVYVKRRGGRIVGATYVAPRAGESIAEIVLAMQHGLRIGDLSGVIHPYPTVAESFKRAADQHFQGQLKPWMRPWLRRYFRGRR